MNETRTRASLIICLVACSAGVGRSQTRLVPAKVEELLAWLPTDTETIFVANQPFAIPAFKGPDSSQPDRQDTVAEVSERFEFLAIGLFGLKDGLLQNYLLGQRIDLAIEGSRHFRPPTGLGEVLYEGCDIAVLAEAVASRGDSFVKESSNSTLRVDSVAGQKISVFEQKLENDTWNISVAFPKPNLVIACTNSDYLREVLERIGGKAGQRALSATLAEWRFVGTDAPFWGLRHYDKSQVDLDPTSPFVDQNVNEMTDKQASGIAFRFDPKSENVVTISYFSGTKDILGFLKMQTPLSMKIVGVVDTAANTPVSYREAAPGVAEIRYQLGDGLPAGLFLLVAMAAFGHAIYL